MEATIWILTQEVNDYNQHGEYFIAGWMQKPTLEALKSLVGSDAEHVLNGGGRIGNEGFWYNLSEIKQGEHY